MRALRLLLAAPLWLVLGASPVNAQGDAGRKDADQGSFLVKPYVQLGDAPALLAAERLQVHWQTEDHDADWSVSYRAGEGSSWRTTEPPSSRRIAVAKIAPHRVYQANLTGLPPGVEVEYRVRKGGETVFSARTRARKGAGQPYRFVTFGDTAAGTPGQKAVAYQTERADPDFVFIAGDIVYPRGRISEYREKFWPVYNADQASPTVGAPLLRSTLFLAAPGNHDIATRDLSTYPDGLAYFLYWSQPLNGPIGTPGAANTPTLDGPEANQEAFLDAAGAAYPRMANFSFDYGNAHWTVLDANSYVDWSDPALRSWVERDLAAAREATWRFVAFHQPGFNSSKKHFDEQRMRRLSETFERGGVDLVIAGHVHNYQRSYPLHFVADPATESPEAPAPAKAKAKGKSAASKGRVGGKWTLDRSFDGKTRTRPDGIIYLVTGAGGAGLYDPEQQDDPASWQEFTYKFISKIHSLTVADVDGPTLTVRQVSSSGEELDRFVVTK